MLARATVARSTRGGAAGRLLAERTDPAARLPKRPQRNHSHTQVRQPDDNGAIHRRKAVTTRSVLSNNVGISRETCSARTARCVAHASCLVVWDCRGQLVDDLRTQPQGLSPLAEWTLPRRGLPSWCPESEHNRSVARAPPRLWPLAPVRHLGGTRSTRSTAPWRWCRASPASMPVTTFWRALMKP